MSTSNNDVSIPIKIKDVDIPKKVNVNIPQNKNVNIPFNNNNQTSVPDEVPARSIYVNENTNTNLLRTSEKVKVKIYSVNMIPFSWRC